MLGTFYLVWSHILLAAFAGYEVMDAGTPCIEELLIPSIQECEMAARELKLSLPQTHAMISGDTVREQLPVGCYLDEQKCCRALWFNTHIHSKSHEELLGGRQICRSPSTTATPATNPLFELSQEQDTELMNSVASAQPGEVVVSISPIDIKVATKVVVEPDLEFVSVAIPNSSATLDIPVSALPGTGSHQLIVKMTVIKQSALETFNTAERKDNSSMIQIEGVVSVDLFLSSALGTPLKLRNLADPIIISIPVNMSRSKGAVCAYFDPDTKSWSTYGVMRIDHPTDFKCAVTHLTIFGAILDLFATGLKCSNAAVLSEEGTSKLLKGDWWYGPAAIWLWCLIFLHTLLIVGGCLVDHRVRQDWHDDCLISHNPAAREKLKEHSLEGRVRALLIRMRRRKRRRVDTACHQHTEHSQDSGRLPFHRLVFDMMVRVCTALSMTIFASGIGAKRGHIALIRSLCSVRQEADLNSADDTAQSHDVAVAFMYNKLQEWLLEGHETLFSDRHPLHSKFLLLVGLLHPWVSLVKFSIQMPSSTRALVLMVRCMAALTVSALFFSSGTPAVSEDSPPECTPGSLMDQLGLMVVIGVISGVLSTLPLMAFAALHTKGFKATDDVKRLRSQLRAWKHKDRTLWGLCCLYLACCIVYSAAFAANVSDRDQLKFLISSAVQVFKQTIIMPFVYAFALTLVVVFLGRFPSVVEESRSNLKHSYPAFLTDVEPDEEHETEPELEANCNDTRKAESLVVQATISGLDHLRLKGNVGLAHLLKQAAKHVFEFEFDAQCDSFELLPEASGEAARVHCTYDPANALRVRLAAGVWGGSDCDLSDVGKELTVALAEQLETQCKGVSCVLVSDVSFTGGIYVVRKDGNPHVVPHVRVNKPELSLKRTRELKEMSGGVPRAIPAACNSRECVQLKRTRAVEKMSECVPCSIFSAGPMVTGYGPDRFEDNPDAVELVPENKKGRNIRTI